MLRKTALITGVAISLLVMAGLFLPREFAVEQAIIIKANPEAIHPFVDDLKQWPRWAPWKEPDPEVVTRYGDLTRGIGASQSWRGKGGSGRLHITASSPDNGIAYDVFFENDTDPSISAIEYERLGKDSTRVIWRIRGEISAPVIGGYIALIVTAITNDMYRKGLLSLKSLVEKNRPR